MSEECLLFGPAYSHILLDTCPRFLPRPSTFSCEPGSTALGGGRPSLGVAVSRKSAPHIRGPHPELKKLWAAPYLLRRSAEREVWLQAEIAQWMQSPWPTNRKVSCAPWGWGLTLHGVLPLLMHWRTVLLRQTSVELQAGQHRTPSQDFTVSALSQSLPMCWVTGKWREELAGVTLAWCKCLFSSSSKFPGWQTLVEFLQHPKQSDWAEQSDARPSSGVS